MTNRIRFTILAAAVITSASAASVAMQMPSRPLAISHACLAVSDGVCFSGSMEWVAKAALSPPHQSTTMIAMIGDAN